MQPLSPCGQGWEAHGGLPEREDPQAESGWSLGAEEQSPMAPLATHFLDLPVTWVTVRSRGRGWRRTPVGGGRRGCGGGAPE